MNSSSRARGPLLPSRNKQSSIRQPWNRSSIITVAACCFLLPFIAGLTLLNRHWHEGNEGAESILRQWQRGARKDGIDLPLPQPRKKADTLVLYVFSNTDAEYEANLRFFLKHGVDANDGCDYIIVIQTGGTSKPLGDLPKVPRNVHFEYHPNECYDWGTMGWVLERKIVNVNQYTYFFFMNSSVRGPFFPPYLWGRVRWQDIFTSRITHSVKLVGSTISCEGSPKDGNVTAEWRTNPHVQSYVVATDKAGLNAMWEEGSVFGCYTSMWDVIYYSELGSSWAVLAAGYTIDCLMIRYQSVDWTDLDSWDCNSRVNPYGENYYDGITIDPFEVIFVKVKELLLERDWSYAVHAAKYDHWLNDQVAREQRDITSNIWSSDPSKLKRYKIGYMRYFGSDCFDIDFYREQNWDQKHVADATQLWEHWVISGQFEARPHRFTCELTAQ